MSPEEMKSEIDSLNEKYEGLQKKKDEIEEKHGPDIFRRRLNSYQRKMQALNKEIAGKIIKLNNASVGDFKKPGSVNLG